MDDEDIVTKPTIETVLDRISALGQSLQDFRDHFEQRMDGLEKRMESFEKRGIDVEYRLDRIESRVDRTVSMIMESRADMRDLYLQLKARIPEPK